MIRIMPPGYRFDSRSDCHDPSLMTRTPSAHPISAAGRSDSERNTVTWANTVGSGGKWGLGTA